MKYFLRSFVSGLAVCLCVPPLLVAAESMPTPPKTYVLFLGADLSVQHEKKIYRVEDVTGSTLRIHVDRQEVLVPTRPGPVGLQVRASLKLASASVKLDQLASGPAYTYGNDPLRKLQEANSNAINAADSQDLSEARVIHSTDNLAAVIQAESHNADLAQAHHNILDAQAGLQASNRQMDSANFSSRSDLNNVGAGANRAALNEGNFDAMEVSFKVSSPVELDRPYMVVLFKFHASEAKPGVDGLVIHAQALDPIDARPRYVRVLKGGLPPGFKFVDCTVHVYNRGVEVATDRSDKRVDLTRDETQQYLVMEHLGAHKGATLPAAALRGTLSDTRFQALTPTQRTRTFYAKVARDGAMLGAFADEEGKIPLDDAGTTLALSEVFFTPALEQGKPVAGVARVRFADLGPAG